MIYSRFALFLVLAIAMNGATAADWDGKYTVLSTGSKSCGNVVSDFKADGSPKLNNSIWVAGYLTAVNEHVIARKNIAEGTDPAAWDLWINNYCVAHPLDSLARAASSLAVELSKRAPN